MRRSALTETLFDNKQKGRRLQRGLPHKRQRPTKKLSINSYLRSRIDSQRGKELFPYQVAHCHPLNSGAGVSQNGISGGGITPGSLYRNCLFQLICMPSVRNRSRFPLLQTFRRSCNTHYSTSHQDLLSNHKLDVRTSVHCLPSKLPPSLERNVCD